MFFLLIPYSSLVLVLNPQSAIRNPQSAIRNPQSNLPPHPCRGKEKRARQEKKVAFYKNYLVDEQKREMHSFLILYRMDTIWTDDVS